MYGLSVVYSNHHLNVGTLFALIYVARAVGQHVIVTELSLSQAAVLKYRHINAMPPAAFFIPDFILVQRFRKILNLLGTKLNGWRSSSMIYEHAIFGPSVRLRVTVKVTYKT